MTSKIRGLFTEVSPTYELVNRVLTLGRDRAWRKKAARMAARKGGDLWLDVCSGTGEMAHHLLRLGGKRTKVVAVDFNPSMLTKAREKRFGERLFPALADAVLLPFPDETFDLVTISFATRNIHLSREILTRNFREFHRVLKPKGCLVNLETSQPGLAVIRRLFHLYVILAVKRVGSWISGSKAGYAYLSSTIPRFYPPEELVRILYQSGFREVDFKTLFFGIAAVHTAVK